MAALLAAARAGGGGRYEATPPSPGTFYGQVHHADVVQANGSTASVVVDQPDRRAYELFFSEPSPRRYGTFVEIGALDGRRYANSLFYEESLGWRGLLMDASVRNYELALTNRPDAVVLYGAVCASRGVVRFLGEGPWARAAEFVNPKVQAMMTAKGGEAAVPVSVPCEPLGDTLRRHGLRRVSLFSLDVEGSEWYVLDSLDLSVVSFDVLVMEQGASCTAGDGGNRCAALLRRSGYCLVEENVKSHNEYWVSEPALKARHC